MAHQRRAPISVGARRCRFSAVRRRIEATDPEESDWVCGSPTRAETPGLLTGLSGVGHQLLRFACPDEVPSVLLLHPPAQGKA
ncbi:lanthionine synthetase LanC family protein [Streptomyces europaeiscabiei]|uniref:lanthionine synthetase LanC family protein n=1 Tax=Streptomyces europaeiscabiei TaxID=146819 RepID=UPI0007661091|nr:lanthionine synthetase LanC family protein [Streptomyces europaeiscabiei]MDX2531380.1 hypothetical protein [Streptomyces europaeiscabiei]MDX2772537.1 hypothetical protein [Streptomyces europaeiscabiei]MDX3716227.1 hypothetical protein [Streptomyces europaeiscabiei]MDX3839716.1 hypothetical protein [Streptomyces europaeiscabiei]MDX3848911.1 hypothetical protein [Streptomyces europaeiscabiei]